MKGWTMSGECMLLGSVSSQQRFRVTDIKALGTSQLSGLSWTNHVIALRQISVTALFYLEDSRRIHPRSVRACQPKDVKRSEWRSAPTSWGGVGGGERKRVGSSFYVFSSPWACLMYIGLARQECCLFYLRSSLHSSDLPLFYFCGLIPSLSFTHHHSGLLFPILTA